MSVSEVEIDFFAETDSIHLSASAGILMRYVQFGNVSPIANDVALLMRLNSFAFSKFENLRTRNRAGQWRETAQASKSGKHEITGKNRAFRPMRESNRELIRRAPLSKTLSAFHLHCIWSQPRASALRDNLSFSLPSAHAVFYCVGEIFFCRATHSTAGTPLCACRTRIPVGQSGSQEHVATDFIYEENPIVCR
jgi:hypothetical protein